MGYSNCQGADAYILLVDAHRPEHIRFGRRILSFVNQQVKLPHIIGLTHTDCPDAWDAEDVILALGLLDERTRPPIVSVNATSKPSVAQALIALVQEIGNFYLNTNP